MVRSELNEGQKKYCLLRASGKNIIDSYVGAGYGGKSKKSVIYKDSCKFDKQEKVRKEIVRLDKRVEEKSFDLARECQGYAAEIIKELVGLLRQKKAPQVKVRAIQELLDRGWGKPKETIETGIQVIWDIKTGRKAENDSQ